MWNVHLHLINRHICGPSKMMNAKKFFLPLRYIFMHSCQSLLFLSILLRFVYSFYGKRFFFQALHIRLGLRIRNLVIAWKKIPLKKIWVFWIWNLSFFFQRNKENRQSNLSNASQLRSEIIFFSQVRNYSNFFKKNWIITYLIINWILIIIEIIINWIIEYWILIK